MLCTSSQNPSSVSSSCHLPLHRLIIIIIITIIIIMSWSDAQTNLFPYPWASSHAQRRLSLRQPLLTAKPEADQGGPKAR